MPCAFISWRCSGALMHATRGAPSARSAKAHSVAPPWRLMSASAATSFAIGTTATCAICWLCTIVTRAAASVRESGSASFAARARFASAIRAFCASESTMAGVRTGSSKSAPATS
eukprot:378896-Prymnesium_polylepis.1